MISSHGLLTNYLRYFDKQEFYDPAEEEFVVILVHDFLFVKLLKKFVKAAYERRSPKELQSQLVEIFSNGDVSHELFIL